jgi:hypothetical protein
MNEHGVYDCVYNLVHILGQLIMSFPITDCEMPILK